MNINENNDLQIIKETIQKYVPKLSEFLDCKSKINEYSKDLYENNDFDFYLRRQDFLKDLIRKQCFDLFGDEAKKFRLNLDGLVTVNIVDHNGILNNPILLGSHLISSAHNLFNSKFDILSLNTAFYPFNNAFYNRGLGYKGEVLKFISKSKSHQLVYYAPPLDFSSFPLEIQNLLNDLDCKNCKTAWEQASKINYKLWPLLFEEKLRPKLPKLITINQDEIVFSILEKLINEKNNFVHDAIFKSDFRDLVKSSFFGKIGAWGQDGKGSFLFWTKDDKNQGVPMKQDGDYLVSAKPGFEYKIKLTQDNVLRALKTREIYPGMVILFAALVFYTGVIPLAGYGSINYLNIMRDIWLEILKKDYPQEFKGIKSMKINKLIGGPVLTYRKDKNNSIAFAYMLDIVMAGGLKEKYLRKMLSMNLNNLLLPAFIDVYNTYIPKEKRKDISITSDDIIYEQLKAKGLMDSLL